MTLVGAPAEVEINIEILDRALLDGVRVGDEQRARLDVGLVPVFSEERPLLGLAGLMDWRGSGRLSAVFRSGFGSARFGEQILVPCDRRLPVARLVLVGLGERAAFDGPRAADIAARLVSIVEGLRAQTVLLALPSEGIERSQTEALFSALLDVLTRPRQITTEDGAAGEGAARCEAGAQSETARDDPTERVERVKKGPGDATVKLDESPESAEPPEESGEPPESGEPGESAEPPEESGESGEPRESVEPRESGEPSESVEPRASGDSAEAPESAGPPEPAESPGPARAAALISQATAMAPRPAPRWWVAADEAVVARLRRVIAGPPRAARGPGLHT